MFEVRRTVEFSRWLAALVHPVGRAGQAIYRMLGGGDKATQGSGIRRAIQMATALMTRMPK